MTSLPFTPDLTATCWRDDSFLATQRLSKDNVLFYFASSPFFDLDSLNARARQQGVPLGKVPGPGVEFVLQDAQDPHLYVILKRLRSSIGALTPLAYYYVLDGTVYQAPTLHAALAARVSKCAHLLRESFEELDKDLNPIHTLMKEKQGDQTQEPSASRQMTDVLAGRRERERMTMLEKNLQSVLNRYSPAFNDSRTLPKP